MNIFQSLRRTFSRKARSMTATIENSPLLARRREWREMIDQATANPHDVSLIRPAVCARAMLQDPRCQTNPALVPKLNDAKARLTQTLQAIERANAEKKTRESAIAAGAEQIEYERERHGVQSLRTFLSCAFKPSSNVMQAIAHHQQQLAKTESRLAELNAEKAKHQSEIDDVLEEMLTP